MCGPQEKEPNLTIWLITWLQSTKSVQKGWKCILSKTVCCPFFCLCLSVCVCVSILLVRGLLSTGCTLNFLRKVLKLKSEKTKLNLSVCHHRLWPVLGQTFTFQGKKTNLPYFPISSAQCSRCQLGCSGTQNFPCISGNCYRSILSEIRVWKSQKPIFLMVA